MGRSAHSRDAGVPYFEALKGLLIVNPRSGRGGPSSEELVGEAMRLGLEVHELRKGDRKSTRLNSSH